MSLTNLSHLVLNVDHSVVLPGARIPETLNRFLVKQDSIVGLAEFEDEIVLVSIKSSETGKLSVYPVTNTFEEVAAFKTSIVD